MKEIARRTTGKQLQEMKQQQEEIKRKNELEQRKKDKKEQAYILFVFLSCNNFNFLRMFIISFVVF